MKSDEHVNIQVNTSIVVASGISDPGRIRSENEDSIMLDESGNFMLLADGMGGHERGAEASQTALGIIQEFLQPEALQEKLMDITQVEDVPAAIIGLSALVGDAVDEANYVLYTRNQEAQLRKYMGTTVVGLIPVAAEESMLWFHVGDSRLYRWRDSNLECLTTDHSAYAEWVKYGQQGEKPSKNVITRAIGPSAGSSADIGWEKWQPSDIYILCSDGLTDMITDAEIVEILNSENNVNDTNARLIEAAIEAGGKDNTSVIVCQV